jgi:hypothetical protein
MADLAGDLKQYMINRINVDLSPEWGYQYDTWGDYIDDPVTLAFNDAYKGQQDVFEAVRKEKEEAYKAAFDFAMLALTITSGAALSWVSGTIQYKYMAKYNPTVTYKLSQVATNTWERTKVTDYDKVGGKLAADLVKDIGKTFFDQTKKLIQIPAPSTPNAQDVANQVNPESFRSALRRELARQKKTLTATIGVYADKVIDAQYNFGQEQVNRLVTMNPNFLKKPYSDQIRAGQKMLDGDLDALRDKWADQWYYFGNNPFPYSRWELARRFERELWALWILQQDYKVVRGKMKYRGEAYNWETIGGGMPIVSQIYNRLVELNVIQRGNQTIKIGQDTDTKDDEDDAIEYPPGLPQEVPYLDGLLRWAKNHGTDPSRGQMEGNSRSLPTISEVHTRVLSRG